MLDIICLIFIIVMAIYGYIKGFVTRLYDLIGTILVIFLSRMLCGTLSSTYTLYHYDTSNAFSVMVGQMINQIIIFVLLFIGLSIIKKLIGMVIKPLLLGITHFFSLTALLDRLLGMIMSIAESVILIYLVLLFVMLPFNSSLINDSKLANYLLDVVPEISESFMNIGECINNEDVTDQIILNVMMSAYDYDFIDEDSFMSVLNEEIVNSQQDLTLTNEQYEKLNNILNELSYSQSDIDNILKNINIGDI